MATKNLTTSPLPQEFLMNSMRFLRDHSLPLQVYIPFNQGGFFAP